MPVDKYSGTGKVLRILGVRSSYGRMHHSGYRVYDPESEVCAHTYASI